MRKCRFCHEDIENAATVCPHCGRELVPGRHTVYPADVPTHEPPTDPSVPLARVSVVDIDMPFGSMVTFMVKWAIAAIPAFLILAFIGLGISLGVGTIAAACAASRPAPARAPRLFGR